MTETEVRPEILLAEDDVDLCDALETLLDAEGFDVTAVGDGSSLLLNLLLRVDRDPALILSDERMPGLCGLEAIKVARRRGFHRPAVLMTAFDDDGILREADRLDVEVVRKPFEYDELCALLRARIEGARATGPAKPGAPSTTDAPQGHGGIQ